MDTVSNLYPISAGSEYSDTILVSCQDALQEAAKESSDAEHSLILIILYRNLITPLNSFNHMIQEMDKQKTRHLTKPLDIDGCAEVRDLSLAFFEMFSGIGS